MDLVCEYNWRKIIGKPYAGKLHVQFDEGELEIEPIGYYASSLLYWTSHLIRTDHCAQLMKKQARYPLKGR